MNQIGIESTQRSELVLSEQERVVQTREWLLHPSEKNLRLKARHRELSDDLYAYPNQKGTDLF